MPNSSNADFQLIVGADIPASTEQLKKDIETILNDLSKTHQNVKLGFEFSDNDAKEVSKDIVEAVNNKLSDKKIDLAKVIDIKDTQKTLGNTDQMLQKISKDLSDILNVVTQINSKSISINFGGDIFKKESVDAKVYKNEIREYIGYLEELKNYYNEAYDLARAFERKSGKVHGNKAIGYTMNSVLARIMSGGASDGVEVPQNVGYWKLAESVEKSIQQANSALSKDGTRSTTLKKVIDDLDKYKQIYEEFYREILPMTEKIPSIAENLPSSAALDEAIANTKAEEERIAAVNSQLSEQKKLMQETMAGSGGLAGLLQNLTGKPQQAAKEVVDVAAQTEASLQQVNQQADRTAEEVGEAFEHIAQRASTVNTDVKKSLGSMELAMSEIDADKLTSIKAGLIKGGVQDTDIPKITAEFEGVTGVITDVTAKYDTFIGIVKNGEEEVEDKIEHISQLTIKGTDDMGKAFQKVISWTPKYDEGVIYDWDKRTAGVIKYTAETNKAAAASQQLAEIERARYEINDKISQVIGKEIDAQRNGVATDAFGYQGLVDFELALQNLAGELGSSITSYDEFKQKLFEIQTIYAGVNNQLKIDTAEIKDNTAAEKEAEAVARAHLQVEREIKRLEGQGKTAERNGVSKESEAYQDLSNYVSSLQKLQQDLDSGNIKLDEFKRRLVEIQTAYVGVNNQLKEAAIAAKEAGQAQDGFVDKGNAIKELQGLQVDIQRSLDKATASGVVDNEAIDRLRTYQQTFSDLEDVVRNNDVSLSNYKAITDAVRSSVTEANKELGFSVQLYKEDEAAAKAAAKAEAELANTVQARGAIGKATAGIDKTVSGAQAVGVSVDNADLQQLAVYRQLLVELDAELDDLNLTQKEFSTIMGNLKAIFQAPEAAVKKLTASLKEQQNHIAKSAKIYDAVKSATEEYADAQNDSNSNVRAAYTVITNLRRELDGAAASYKNGKITAAQYDEAVKSTNDELNEQVKVLKNAGYGADETASKFAQLTQQLTRFITPLYLARKAWQTVKEMANVVIELEDAFAQLQIVTGATDDELEEFYGTSAKIAADLGKSITDIAASIEVFSRLGYSLPDATQLAQYATILSNVAGVSTDEATTGLTSIIKGYNMHVEKAEHVSDVLISIGQKYAVSAGEMMEAYERSGAALAATNTSFEKSAAIIAAANAAIQNSSTVGKVLPMHTVMYA